MKLKRDSSGLKVDELQVVIALVCFFTSMFFYYLHEGYCNEEK